MLNKDAIIVVTGAAGFIGSCLTGYLNMQGFSNIVIVDDFGRGDKIANFEGKQFINKIEREAFFAWVAEADPKIDFVFHIGARTDTTEFDYAVHEALNVEYSIKIWNYCTAKNIPLVYASSA